MALTLFEYQFIVLSSCLHFQGYNKTGGIINLKEGEMGKTFQTFKFAIKLSNLQPFGGCPPPLN